MNSFREIQLINSLYFCSQTPVNALPAYRLGQAADMVHSCSYTLLFNILHMPAGAVPVTLVRDDEQFYEDIGSLHNDWVTALAKNICRESSGLPIGVQLVGWPNDDERVLNVMGQLEHSLRLQSPLPVLANVIDIYSD
jgi:Asp-tRNA(Asn)/Glu-tRNA(Gln) amidotransferase A subunit family amidase